MSNERLLGCRVCCRIRAERKEADGEVPLIGLNPLPGKRDIWVFIEDIFCSAKIPTLPRLLPGLSTVLH